MSPPIQYSILYTGYTYTHAKIFYGMLSAIHSFDAVCVDLSVIVVTSKYKFGIKCPPVHFQV